MDRKRAIREARRGREAGFRWLFEHDQAVLQRFVAGLTRLDSEAISDVLQNTFVRAFNNLDTLKDDAAYVSWLLRIARRESLRFIGRQRSAEPIEELTVVCEREARLAEIHEKERLLEAIRTVAKTVEPERVRETALRYYLGEPCTTEALARDLGVPHATVRKRLYSFRQKLKKQLLES